MPPVHRRFLLLAAATAALVASCALIGPAPPALVPGRAAVFPHAVHLGEDAGLGCLDCHLTAATEAAAGMPGAGLCIACHDEETDRDKPVARTPAGFVPAGAAAPAWTAVTALPDGVSFDHGLHAAAEVDCAACHAGLEDSSAVDESLFVPMEKCLGCHGRHGVEVAGDCLGCHRFVTRNKKPASHTGAWEAIHGQIWRAGAVRNSPEDCALCHGPGQATRSCAACHQAVPPKDHTPFYKNQGHGPLALFDRSRCQACHEEDACLQCHLSVRPRSHGPGWGSPGDQHCVVCHFDAPTVRGCAVCHLQGPVSHDLASPPLPPSVPAHATTNQCMVCHGSVMPPTHPISGDGAWCRNCHR